MRRLTQLHERTRRRIGLSGFVLLCLLPTLVMFTWGVSRYLPTEEANVTKQLQQLFGLKVTVKSVDHPQPGLVRLRGLVFDRPHLTNSKATSTRPVARLETLDIYRHQLADPDKNLRDTICMTGTGLEVSRDELPELVRLLRDAVEYRLSSAKVNVKLSLDRIRLFNESNKTSDDLTTDLATETKEPQPELSGIQFHLLALKEGPRAVLDFRLINPNDDTASKPIRFQAGQHLDTHLWFEFDTRSERVPCRLLGMLLPQFNSLGPDAQFCGSFRAEHSPGGWRGELPRKALDNLGVAAELSDVDLRCLIQSCSSQVLSGRVNITIAEGTVSSGRIEQLSGRVVSVGSGEIGQPLLTAATKELGLRFNSINTTDPVISYERLAAHFDLNKQGILIDGGYQCPSGEQLILLDANSRAILWNSEPGKSSDLSALLRTLASEAEAYIPRSVEHLARLLPVK